MRVVVTRIEPDGTMRRRVVDTAGRSDGPRWEDLAARAAAYPPPYRPVPGTSVYHISMDDHLVQVGEYDLDGPLRDLATVVLAVGDELLPGPAAGECPLFAARETGGRGDIRQRSLLYASAPGPQRERA
ncbi:MAG TPA: hypothetical protein VLW44_01070 [Streptosporangiaceae bacterium]|nr:hypothetical protein [Streptosporangiaceae bacterium]